MADLPYLAARSAFADLVAALPAGAGDVVIAERPQGGIASILAFNGDHSALARRIAAMGLVVPPGAASASRATPTIVGTGPNTWLVFDESAAPDWATVLAANFTDTARIVDQSSSYAMLRLSGPSARMLLSRGVFLDLTRDVFFVGKSAVTMIAHIGVILWQRNDAPTFEIAVIRSMAGSFWHWIQSAAAGGGLHITRES